MNRIINTQDVRSLSQLELDAVNGGTQQGTAPTKSINGELKSGDWTFVSAFDRFKLPSWVR